MNTTPSGERRVLRGGVSLIAATVLFIAVFSYLAATFDHPGVLDRPAAALLPALRDLGTISRALVEKRCSELAATHEPDSPGPLR